MTGWLLSLIGVIFLAVLFDVVYPNGKTNAFCKSIFGLVAIIVLISPILKIDLNSQISETSFINEKLNNSIQKSKDEYYKLKIINGLKNINIDGVDVEIDSIMENSKYSIENIYIDTANIVLTENVTHTNKYEVIIQEISKLIEIDKERIVIYG